MPVFDTGSSILVLESVFEEDEGLYFCQAKFDGTDIFNSSRAVLSFNCKDGGREGRRDKGGGGEGGGGEGGEGGEGKRGVNEVKMKEI